MFMHNYRGGGGGGGWPYEISKKVFFQSEIILK